MFRYYEQVAPIYLSLVKIKYYKIQGDPPPNKWGPSLPLQDLFQKPKQEMSGKYSS